MKALAMSARRAAFWVSAAFICRVNCCERNSMSCRMSSRMGSFVVGLEARALRATTILLATESLWSERGRPGGFDFFAEGSEVGGVAVPPGSGLALTGAGDVGELAPAACRRLPAKSCSDRRRSSSDESRRPIVSRVIAAALPPLEPLDE